MESGHRRQIIAAKKNRKYKGIDTIEIIYQDGSITMIRKMVQEGPKCRLLYFEYLY